MARVTICTSPFCPYCVRATFLLSQKGVLFQETDVAVDATQRERMFVASGRRTVLQIFINAILIGGSEEVRLLAQQDGLDALTKAG